MPSQTATRHAPPAPTGPRGGAPDARPSTAPGSATPRVRPRPGLLGPVRLTHVILVEAIAAALLLGWTHGRITLVVGGVVGVLLLVPVLLRFGGLTLVDMLRARAAFRRRARRAALAPQGPDVDPALAPVLECEPALRVVAHTVEADGGTGPSRRERREIGMVGDGTFLSALIQVETPDRPLRPQADAFPLPLRLLADGLRADDVVLDSVQLLQYAQPAPAPHLPETALAARAYRELPDGSTTPGLRLTWVAVRLDPERCRSAIAARGGGETGARKALQRGVDQLASRLMQSGLRATVLDASQVTAAIGTATCPNPVAVTRGGSGSPASGAGAPRRSAETTKAWKCDDRWHRSYWIGRWPALRGDGTAQLVHLLTNTPALGSCFSLTLRAAGAGAVALEGHVRVTVRGESELATTGRQLETRARSAGISLVGLDLEQVPGVLATLPLGGTR
ncbi:type VII secretion protein EccE [Streptacidiphilus sp. MAP12-33]|uniref:type VII secretion protein EccE n=1 Tax=Streptacidiphilus sp. MAP12-33 TaxID=3156266 RepID=UPI003512EDFE